MACKIQSRFPVEDCKRGGSLHDKKDSKNQEKKLQKQLAGLYFHILQFNSATRTQMLPGSFDSR